MGSRIHRDGYVQFRGEAMETCLGNKARRCGLSLLSAPYIIKEEWDKLEPVTGEMRGNVFSMEEKYGNIVTQSHINSS